MVVAFVAATSGLLGSDAPLARAILAGGGLVAALGLYDDLRGAGAPEKLLVQFAAGTLAWSAGVRIDVVALPFLPTLHLGALGLPATLLWIAGVANAVNLVDGLDGLAGTIALFAASAIAVLGALGGQPEVVLVAAALSGAILGFLVYNVSPASIFMGDSGSMFLGFVLATASIQIRGSDGALPALVPLTVLGIPLLDTTLAIVRRAARGAPIAVADRGHLHHQLLARGWSQGQIVFAAAAAATLLGASAVALSRATPARAIAIVAALAAVAVAGLRALHIAQVATLRRLLAERRRSRALGAALRDAARRVRAANDASELWDSVRAAAGTHGADATALRIVRDEHAVHFTAVEIQPAHTRRTRHSLGEEREGAGHLELVWMDDRPIDETTERAVELLRRHVRSAARKIDVENDRWIDADARSSRTGSGVV
jgi:UDP-GlcNAc:undecaprenyl-phosphate GlcNAc-1-phosphate transferase